MPPKVSIIVPIYNVEKYLDRCINSLINQTLTDIEIIMVDDESPDNCPIMCDNWAKKDSRIKVIHKKNGGLGYARNSGIELAQGEYVGFIDSDDYVDPQMFETLYNKCKKLDLDICYAKYCRVFANGTIINEYDENKECYYLTHEEVRTFALNMVGPYPGKKFNIQYSMSVCRGLFRKALFHKSHVFFVSEKSIASEDLLFHIDFLQHVQRIGYLPKNFYFYFVNSSSITTTYSNKLYDKMIELGKELKTKLENYYPASIYKPHYSAALLGIFKSILFFESNKSKSFWKRYHRIKEVCALPLWENIYNTPEYKKYDKKNFLITIFLKHKMFFLLTFLYKLNIGHKHGK